MIALFLGIALAYIPHSHFILQQMGENHGSGTYQIVQELAFQNADERVVIQETWTVDEGLQMHLEAKGPDVLYTAKYDFRAKYFLSQDKRLVKADLPKEFFENLFYLKEAKDIARRLYNMGVIGAEILSPQKRFYHLSQVEYKGQAFLNLSRLDEQIAFAFGYDLNQNKPGFWVSQSDFHLKKIRMPNGTTILADNYDVYTKNLHLPKQRSLEWGPNKTPIQILSVSRIIHGPNTKKLLSTSNIDGLSPIQFGEKEIYKAIQSFYQRFR